MKKIIFVLLALFLLPSDALATAAEEAPLIGNVCPVCHFCAAPLGVCVLIWAIVALLLLILLTAILGRKKRCPACGEKNKRRAAVCIYCGQPLRKPTPQSAPQASFPPLDANSNQMQASSSPQPDTAPIRPAMTKPLEQPHSVPESKPATRICPSCGKELPARAVFCSACGRRL